MRPTPALTCIFLVVLAAGCQTVSPPGNTTAVLAEPVAAQPNLHAEAPRFVVDAGVSEVRILVWRDGPLARFGHNHVVVGRPRGELHAGETAAASGFQLEIPVDSFAVDPAAARAEEGPEFSSAVSDQAREGTRENMLGKDVLDAASHPLMRIASLALLGPQWNPTVTARVTLRGATRDVRFPAAVFRQGDTITVVASFVIRQSAFGIEPFSALNGGLRVRDDVDIRIRIVAQRG